MSSVVSCRIRDTLQEVPRVAWYATGGLLALVGTFKYIRHRKRVKQQQKWAEAGVNVVVLHQFPRGYTIPNASPFCLKLETYLRMANIDHIIDTECPQSTETSKAPWITLNGSSFTDSNQIIEMLGKKLSIDLSRHLSRKDKAVAKAVQLLLDEHFVGPFALDRYFYHNISELLNSVVPSPVARILEPLLDRFVRKLVKKRAMAMGIGQHSKDVVYDIAFKDLEIFSACLGEQAYLTGDMPVEADCALFAWLAQILCASTASSPFRIALEEDDGKFSNLKQYFFRMKNKYWKDWDKVLSVK